MTPPPRLLLAAGAATGVAAAAVAAMVALGPLRPVGDAAEPGPSPSEAASLDFFVGFWAGHGRQMTVSADQTAAYRSRTYTGCDSPERLPGEPCDDLLAGTIGHEELTMRLERRNGDVVAVVTGSNNPGDGPGTTFRLRAYPQDSYFTMEWISGGLYERRRGFEFGMCGEHTPPEVNRRVCGA